MGNRRRSRGARAGLGAAIITLAIVAAAAPSRACDVCAIYTATELQERRTGPYLGVGEQFTRYGSLLPQPDGSIRDEDERLNSSITQLLLGYTVHPKVSVQLNVPFIHRWFRRFENDEPADSGLHDGTETGFGDLSLVGIVHPYSWVSETALVRFSFLAGIKLPSGGTSRLEEDQELFEQSEGASALDSLDAQGRRATRDAHHIPTGSVSGINGHDLTLGSGSVDGVFGGSAFASWQRFFLTTVFQYALRSEGAFDYRFGDGVDWFIDLGFFPVVRHDLTLAARFAFSGQYQDADEIEGESQGDSLLWLYVGPGVTFTWGTSLAAEFTADLPVKRDNDVGLVPIYRLRGGVTWRF
jgi:hypothetical protein